MSLADQSNILRLYEELGVRPEHGVERLTERYRQRLRELHPDAQAESDGAAVDDGIGWMTRSYRDALAFEREHGRLPGAGLGDAAPPLAGPALARRRNQQRTRQRPPSQQLWRWLLFIAALALLIAFMAPDLVQLVEPAGRRR